MANPEHLEILKQGAEQWNKWRRGPRDEEPARRRATLRKAKFSEREIVWATDWVDLSGANLGKADLIGADLIGANLSGADLSEARLNRANLSEANLSGADLNRANLSEADLSEATLRGARLGGADLRGVNLSRANLSGADFSKAIALATIFADIDLSAAMGLETVQHVGPSTVGVDTIYKSRGKIPEVFLRGCGVPDEFIAYIGSMVGRPIEFYSCFISYSTHDQEFAERLHADLQAKGVRCWFAPHDIKGGRKIHEQIDEAIRLHDRLLLILSEHSMSSEWVKTEIAKARKREVQENQRTAKDAESQPKKPKQVLFLSRSLRSDLSPRSG